jgi:hypothetical protein
MLTTFLLSTIGVALLADTQSVKPYTIQYKNVVTYPDGKQLPPGRAIVAGRSNGDSMEQNLEPNSPRLVTLPAKGVMISVAPSGNNVTTIGSGIPRPPRQSGEMCEDLPGRTGESRIILGFKTLKTLVTSGGHIEEAWVAPALNCQPLERTNIWKVEGQPDAVTKMTAVSAVAGEPDPALFKLPEHSNEVPPSVFWRALGQEIPSGEGHYYRDKAEREALAKRPVKLVK